MGSALRVSTLCVSILVAFLTLLGFANRASSSPSVEIDVIATVRSVVDGDTFDAFPVGRVRLADINAPELGTPEGEAAKTALSRLILGKTIYLDVDDLYIMDRYNRVVAVAYIRYNDTHMLNINKWLVDSGHAVIVDYPNEFNPLAWTLYVYYPRDVEMRQQTTITATIIRTITTTYTETHTYIQFATLTATSFRTITLTATKDIVMTMPITTTMSKIDERTHTIEITKTITAAGAGMNSIAIMVIAAISLTLLILLLTRFTRR